MSGGEGGEEKREKPSAARWVIHPKLVQMLVNGVGVHEILPVTTQEYCWNLHHRKRAKQVARQATKMEQHKSYEDSLINIYTFHHHVTKKKSVFHPNNQKNERED